MIERVLPDGVIAVESFTDDPGELPFPGEEDLVENAVEGRRREFVTARRCAREALAKLGHPLAPIRRGPMREPQWPSGVAGAITHCAGYRAAAVVPKAVLSSVGIDAEPDRPLPADVEESIALPAERQMLASLAGSHPGIQWDRLLFSAKESVYKAWFPLTRQWLDFEDARVVVHPENGFFTATVLPADAPIRTFHGRFTTGYGLIVTAVSVAAGGTSQHLLPGH
ncbi:4'-phosphopantetheinyl transferase family protein [Actinoplanes palleronii]|uniref:4'-phosphopantetheinyl transferase n=1 Tax=Actinoplanes palleronii TaxID=113570 RepID=A0ABQ4BIZ9_9ACTN|nr:4'-phosphopantetheinyl transferase superfamily protein [Actinoplanes palleronii]GIE70649.1 4'-phosphopantetheinyl transferase [Actinoplanes palleronii]